MQTQSQVAKNPKMSDLRIVLLGKNVSENSRVGNFILGRAAFVSEAPPADIQQHSERVRGQLEDRHITVINTPHLLDPNLSYHQIIQGVKECVSLCDPGPHVIILVLQYEDFSEVDCRRVKYVLDCFSEQAIKHTIVLTTDKETSSDTQKAVRTDNSIHQLIKQFGSLDLHVKEWHSEILKKVKKNQEEYLICEIYEETEGTLLDEENIKSERAMREIHKEQRQRPDIPVPVRRRRQTSPPGDRPSFSKLNLALCGSDSALKTSISYLIMNHSTSRSEPSSEFVVQEGEVFGHQISLVELPALTNTLLSEEELMQDTHHCLSLCDPGVHVFLMIISDGPLTDEDKAEMEKIQRMFSSEINSYAMVLIMLEKKVCEQSNIMNILYTSAPKPETSGLEIFGDRYFVLENKSEVPALLQDVENIIQQNSGKCYTAFMYLQAQVELERNKHRAEIEELKRKVMKTQSTAGVTHSDDNIRIVLLGKTGVGKSATGNTILRKEAFKSTISSRSVTRECQKVTTEHNRRLISVIDTPGLFDTGIENIDTRKEIVKCMSMAAPGPHVFLLVLSLGRFTNEEKEVVKMIQEIFGEKSKMYTMVLFTRGDDLKGTRIEDFIEENDSLQNIIQQCGNRYHVFNNNETKDQTQVTGLLDKIDIMVAGNGGSYYTNEMFKRVENNIQEEQERLLKEREEETKRREQELTAKYKAEIEEIKTKYENEKQEIQNELKRKEEEFKKREEEIKKETDKNLKKEMQRKLKVQRKEFKEINKRSETALQEKQNNYIKCLENKHKKEKDNLQKTIKKEVREQAEYEFREKLEKEVAKALQDAEDKLPYCAKRARDWSQYGNYFGAPGILFAGAAGGFVGSSEDTLRWILRSFRGSKSENTTSSSDT